jgi:serine O-acetyltransferase
MKVIKSEYSKFLIDVMFYKNYSKMKGPFGVLSKDLSFKNVMILLFTVRQLRFCFYLRLACALKKFPILGTLISCFLNLFYSSDISVKAYYGPGIFFPHPMGLVIGNNVELKGFSVIFNDVSLGKKAPGFNGGMPQIGYKNLLCSGSKILGPIKTANSVVVGANSILSRSVGSFSTVVGVNTVVKGVYFKDYD